MDIEKDFVISDQTREDYEDLQMSIRKYLIQIIFDSCNRKLDDIQNKFDDEIQTIVREVEQLTFDDKFEWLTYKRLKANQMYRLNNFTDAIKDYYIILSAIQIGEKQPFNDVVITILNNLGIAFQNLKKFEQAEKAYKIVTGVDPINTKALLRLAQLYYDQKNRQDDAMKYVCFAQDECEKNKDEELLRTIKQLRSKILESRTIK